MSSLTDYNGLDVVAPDPTSDGGFAINNNFKKLSTRIEAYDPTSTDDQTQGYGLGSRWYNTATEIEWICMDDSTSAAIWNEIAAAALQAEIDSKLSLSGGTMTGDIDLGSGNLTNVGGLSDTDGNGAVFYSDAEGDIGPVGQVNANQFYVGAGGIIGAGGNIAVNSNLLMSGSTIDSANLTNVQSIVGSFAVYDAAANYILSIPGDGTLAVNATTTYFRIVAATQVIGDNSAGIDMTSNTLVLTGSDGVQLAGGPVLDQGGNPIIDATAGNGTATYYGFILESIATTDLPDPTQNEGRVIYDSTSKTFKGCNGTSWIAL